MLQDNCFYFIKEQYYIDFPDNGLMKNHETVNGNKHSRPCFYIFKDSSNPEIYWLIPISSKYQKYKDIHDKKVKRYGSCKTIVLGYVLNQKRAFLIQNMCPVTSKYIDEKYILNGATVTIGDKLRRKLYHSTKDTLFLYEKRNANYLIFPDVRKIKRELIRQLEQEKEIAMQNIQKSKPRKQKIVMKFPNRDNNNRGMGR